MAVTDDIPESYRGGIIATVMATVGQDWPPAEIAPPLIFKRIAVGLHQSTANPTRARPAVHAARMVQRLERTSRTIRAHDVFGPATASDAWGRRQSAQRAR